MGVDYLTEDILINALGDEEGIGEIWDLYELMTNRKEFLKYALLMVAIMVGIAGIAMIIVGIFFSWVIFGVGAGLVCLSGVILLFYLDRKSVV